MVRAVEQEITRLEQIRAQVLAHGSDDARKPRRLSEDGRRRIAEAQRRRWAKQPPTQSRAAAL